MHQLNILTTGEENIKNNKTILLDGFPRTLNQAKLFKFPIQKLIHISVPEFEIKSRINGLFVFNFQSLYSFSFSHLFS